LIIRCLYRRRICAICIGTELQVFSENRRRYGYRYKCTSVVCRLTAYGAVKNAGLKPDDNVVVVGTGGLGLMAIQLAKAVTGAKIIAMDLDDQKLDVAKKNGADVTINSKKEDPVKAIMEFTDNLGADAVIDFVNASKTVEIYLRFLRRRGRLVLVGLFGGTSFLSVTEPKYDCKSLPR